MAHFPIQTGELAQTSVADVWPVRQLRRLYGVYKNLLPTRYLTGRFIKSLGGQLQVDTLIEVGAGSCPFERDLQRAFKVRNYVPSDRVPNDRTMLRADARNLPIPAHSVDMLVALDVIQWIPDFESALREARRVLLPGGALLLTYTFIYGDFGAHDYHRWTLEGMEQELAKAGFEVVAHRMRGGMMFALTMMITDVLQKVAMGAARHTTNRSRISVLLRMGLASVIVFPFQLLGWMALGLDRLLPSCGCYFGGLVLAQSRRD